MNHYIGIQKLYMRKKTVENVKNIIQFIKLIEIMKTNTQKPRNIDIF